MTDKMYSNTVTVDLDHESQIRGAEVDIVYKHGRSCGQRVHLSGCQGAYVY